MLKNTASQVIGAQMVSATDGSAFTGSVTVAVTGDGGTQATGSVGSGACTHEGNGFHTYAPAQAETNYSHVAFTFTGSGAIPVTVQVYPITLADYKADVSGLSTLTAQQVWEYATRVLTAATNLSIPSASDVATAVWGAGTRTLTSFGSLVADIWAAATSGLSTAGSIGKLLVDNINATISSRLASASYTAPPSTSDIKTAMEVDGSKLDHLWEMTEDDGGTRRLTTNALEQAPSGSGGDATAANQTTIINHLTGIKGATFDTSTDSLEAIRTRGDLAWITGTGGVAGAGADAVTITIQEPDSDPIADCAVWITSDSSGATVVAGTLWTDDAGEVTFQLDDGVTYYLWARKSGEYEVNGQSFVAEADA